VTYQVQVLPGVLAALDRQQEADHVGAALIVSTFDELAADPRPATAHVLNETSACTWRSYPGSTRLRGARCATGSRTRSMTATWWWW